MSDSPPRTLSGTLRTAGLGLVLENARKEMVGYVRARLEERRRNGWNDLSDSEIETLVRCFGNDAVHVASNAIGAANEFLRRASASDSGEPGSGLGGAE